MTKVRIGNVRAETRDMVRHVLEQSKLSYDAGSDTFFRI